jgi:hypothetical protein
MSDIDPAVQVHIDAANLAESQGNHQARSASASAALAAMAAAFHPVPGPEPRGAIQAAARLEHIQKSPEWRDKFFAGDVSTRAEFDRLNQMVAAAPPHDLALFGIEPPSSVDENAGQIVSEHDLPAGAAYLIDRYGDIGAKEILRGELVGDDGKVLPIDEVIRRVDRAERLLAHIHRDPEYRRQLLSGSQDHRGEFERITATIVLGNAMMDKFARGLP